MKLLEYEAKTLLKQAGAPVPESYMVTSDTSAVALSYPFVLKSQVPVGGRGKAGGIRIVETAQDYQDGTQFILNLAISGHTPRTLLAEEKLDIVKEFYLAIVIDRASQSIVLLAHQDGGIDIETAQHDDSKLKRVVLNKAPDDTVTKQLLEHFSLKDSVYGQLHMVIDGLWAAFTQNDALLVEVNPLVLTKGNELVCADAKIELDDTAAFRHKWDYETVAQTSQFVILNDKGTVASMANGAGLAMATVDAIEAAGATTANFLDIGGGTNTEGMVDALKKISEIKSVKAIVINVFAGITRCDEVAEAIVIAKERFTDLPPLFIRLSGTNQEQGVAILHKHNMTSLSSLEECVQSALKEVSHV